MLLDYAEELPPPNFGENAEATFLTEAKRWENQDLEVYHEMLGNIYETGSDDGSWVKKLLK